MGLRGGNRGCKVIVCVKWEVGLAISRIFGSCGILWVNVRFLGN